MTKKLTLLLLSLAMLFNSGCWSRKEVEDLSIVSAMAIDRVQIAGRPKWQVTYQIFKPALRGVGMQGGGANRPAVWVVSSIGETLRDARVNLNTRTSRIIFTAHTGIIIIGEETARSTGLQKIIDALLRDKEIRLRSWVVISEGKAADILTVQPELEQDIATELENLIANTRYRVTKDGVQDLKEVVAALASPGRDVYTGRVNSFKINKKQAAGGPSNGEPKSIRLHGIAIFSKDLMVGWMSDTEAQGYQYVAGKAQQAEIPVFLNNSGPVTVHMVDAGSKILPHLKDGQLKIKIEIEADGDLDDLNGFQQEVTPEFMEELGDQVAKEIKRRAEKTVGKAQEMRADIFGFGESVYKKYPHYWKEIQDNWRDYYAGLPVDISVKVNIRRTGMITDPIKVR